MNLITFVVFQKWVTDSQSGMRAFSFKALQKMELDSLGHEICSEVIGEAKRNNLKLKEVPIETIYTDYSKRKGQYWLNAINIFTKIILIKLAKK